MKKVLVIKSSLRLGSNSDILADAFADGARDSGNDVTVVSLKDKSIGFCRGCMACQKIGHCVFTDDSAEITQKIHDNDVIVFATPIYYYTVAGQLKTLIDRGNWLYTSDYHFKDVYLLATAADKDDETSDGAKKDIQGWVDCFERAAFKGTIFAGGVDDAGSIQGRNVLIDAYNLGRDIK